MGMKRTFSQKQNKKQPFKIQLDEKNLPFHDALDNFVFSLNLHCMSQAAFAPYNKGWSKPRTLKQLNQRETNPGPIESHSLMLLLSI